MTVEKRQPKQFSGENYTFHQIIKEKYGLKVATHYGIGGTRIARQTVPTREKTRWDYTFEMRAEIMDRDVDAVVVFGGTNDYGHGDAKFGTMDSEDIYTYCGAINSLITKLKNDFPDAEIIFMTPIHRSDENTPVLPDNKILKDYVDAMLEICKKRNIKVIDLFKINPINPMDKNVVPDVVDNNNKEMQLLAFCEKYRTRQEIADFLGIKTLPHAVKNHVMPLVDKGLIELEYPEKPRSSKQRYKTRQ